MKNLHLRINILTTILVAVSITGLLYSCENKPDAIPKSELLNLPSATVKDFKTVFADSGKTVMIMFSPLMEHYENNNNPYSEFRNGITVLFYDGNETAEAYVTSKYAKYTNSDNLWELKDSVVVVNENNDKLETEVLFWDREKDIIYTDRFVKISNDDQIIQGFGFESDSHLRNRKIKKVSATIFFTDEEE